MNILALDLATKTGWALDGASGVYNFAPRRDESGDMRLVKLRGKLNDLLAAGRIDLVVFEGARCAMPKMQGALIVTAELVSVVKTWCMEKNIPYRAYGSNEIKRHATNKGNANKDAMIRAARAKWPHTEIIDDNHADALWLLDLARSDYGGTP